MPGSQVDLSLVFLAEGVQRLSLVAFPTPVAKLLLETNMKLSVLIIFLSTLVAACGSSSIETAYVSLDECDFLIPAGYFVNSGSIRDKGVAIVSSRSSGAFGSISINYGVEEIVSEYEEDGLRVRVIQEQQTENYRYFVLGIKLGEASDEQEVIRAEVGAYTLSIVGQAKTIWKQHLICPT